jgi:hypothetical protein
MQADRRTCLGAAPAHVSGCFYEPDLYFHTAYAGKHVTVTQYRSGEGFGFKGHGQESATLQVCMIVDHLKIELFLSLEYSW